MKKIHYRTLKFHTMYSFVLAAVFLFIILRFPDITLGASMTFLIFYIAGNGVIHVQNNKLERDTLIEYILISIIAIIIIIGTLIK